MERQVAVWRKSIVVSAEELISLREQVAGTVERELLPELGHDAAASEGTRPTVEAAYDPYLRSLAFSLEVAPNQEAIDLLEQSVELDPNYAPTWTQLAVRYYHRAAYGGGLDGVALFMNAANLLKTLR